MFAPVNALNMKTVLLAAGEGTRMRPLTATRPKPMLPVADRPLLGHVARAAVAAGASELIVVVGYEADVVRSHFGENIEDVPITYVEQSVQRGTAHALAQAAPHLDDEPFVVLNGDALYDRATLADLYQQNAAVGSYTSANPSAYGVLDVDDGVVTDVEEKPISPASNLVNTGAYVFPGEATEYLDVAESSRGEREITDVLDRVIERFEVTSVEFDRWLDVGRPWELLEANEWKIDDLDRSLDGEVADGATVTGDVVVEEGATLEPGVVIEGPAYVRSGASIGPNAYVRGSTYIGPDVHIGHSVEVKNSVLFEGASAGHLAYVGDSILGADVNFGAGTITANLRHDGEPVTMRVKGETVSTDRRKFGVVCGDGAKTGINTSLNAGVTLGAGAATGPGEELLSDRRS
ncbi:UDP-N-acetylglucosamine diphosphorylase [Halanaeroarchaeum sulfurireducens]|uniref:Bifunctional protein GlmU n=2 Tax=Halanaeroarchaeum sulfurireducens TaxID=1604004 RepID=A0A0N9MV12_9EURY|nr:UDP-N-acetylglucosamine diphosphorylase [Halanaeroarchaeum sulfurireducens]